MEKPSAKKKVRVKFFEFKGLMAPVFTCFRNDKDLTLDLSRIDQYAAWLKSQNILGILVNEIVGEGPSLGIEERKLQTEAWWMVAQKHDMVLMVQVGAAPISDVFDLAEHANNLGVHAILALPDLFYKPRNIHELLTYCQSIAKRCRNRPFLYYHVPEVTGVDVDITQFCDKADDSIVNFYGILYYSTNLETAARCLKPGRVVMMCKGALMTSAMLLGFDAFMFPGLNICPKLFCDIYVAMENNDVELARKKQKELSAITRGVFKGDSLIMRLAAMKTWFNQQVGKPTGPGFSAGPRRHNR